MPNISVITETAEEAGSGTEEMEKALDEAGGEESALESLKRYLAAKKHTGQGKWIGKCYLVLQGGGVRGIALLGAVERLLREGVKVVGYGGSSAGAMVSSLLAVGYKPYELIEIIVRKDFADFTKGKVWSLDPGSVIEGFPSGKGVTAPFRFLYWICGVVRLVWKNRSMIRCIIDRKGLYDGEPVNSWIKNLIEQKGPRDTKGGVTFGTLKEEKNVDLKIVTANVVRQNPEVFDYRTFARVEIVDAIRASMAFPFIFTPFQHGSAAFVDGGIVSNFPGWVFDDVRGNIPVVGIKLKVSAVSREIVTIGGYVSAVINTTLEGSNDLQNARVTNMHVIEIDTEDYSTFDFGLTGDEKVDLFTAGYETMDEYIKRLKLRVRK